jgi:hypothetical protein
MENTLNQMYPVVEHKEETIEQRDARIKKAKETEQRNERISLMSGRDTFGELATCGDLPGHEFHGNQHTGGAGGAQMKASEAIRTAESHAHEGPMSSSAKLRLEDAKKLHAEGKHEDAHQAAADSLKYSVGVLHEDYKKHEPKKESYEDEVKKIATQEDKEAWKKASKEETSVYKAANAAFGPGGKKYESPIAQEHLSRALQAKSPQMKMHFEKLAAKTEEAHQASKSATPHPAGGAFNKK